MPPAVQQWAQSNADRLSSSLVTFLCLLSLPQRNILFYFSLIVLFFYCNISNKFAQVLHDFSKTEKNVQFLFSLNLIHYFLKKLS